MLRHSSNNKGDVRGVFAALIEVKCCVFPVMVYLLHRMNIYITPGYFSTFAGASTVFEDLYLTVWAVFFNEKRITVFVIRFTFVLVAAEVQKSKWKVSVCSSDLPPSCGLFSF